MNVTAVRSDVHSLVEIAGTCKVTDHTSYSSAASLLVEVIPGVRIWSEQSIAAGGAR